jgi:hypothetical protein
VYDDNSSQTWLKDANVFGTLASKSNNINSLIDAIIESVEGKYLYFLTGNTLMAM